MVGEQQTVCLRVLGRNGGPVRRKVLCNNGNAHFEEECNNSTGTWQFVHVSVVQALRRLLQILQDSDDEYYMSYTTNRAMSPYFCMYS